MAATPMIHLYLYLFLYFYISIFLYFYISIFLYLSTYLYTYVCVPWSKVGVDVDSRCPHAPAAPVIPILGDGNQSIRKSIPQGFQLNGWYSTIDHETHRYIMVYHGLSRDVTWLQSCLAASSVFRCYALPNSNLYRHSNPGQTLLFWAGAGDDQCRCGKNLRPLNQGHTRQGRTASLPTDPPKWSTIKTGSCCKALSSIRCS